MNGCGNWCYDLVWPKDSMMSEVFSNFNDSLILQCLSAWSDWPQHLHPLNCPTTSHPVLCLQSAKARVLVQVKPVPRVFHQHSALAVLKSHQGWLSLMLRDPNLSSCLSELEGSGSDPVQTPGIKLALLHVVAGCSLSSWDLTTLLVANVLIVIGARQICP